jgi:UbiD family decarboxylase
VIASFRELVADADVRGELVRLAGPRAPELAAAAALRDHDPQPVLLEDVRGWHVAGNLLVGRESYARALEIPLEGFLERFEERLGASARFSPVEDPPCQEVIVESPDLGRLPILTHYSSDAGPYVTAGVWIVEDPELGRNLSYHRWLIRGSRQGTVRVVEQRGMDRALRARGGRAEAAAVIGAPPQVLLAAALAPAPEVDELELAARLAPVALCRALTVDLDLPAEAELIIEGRFTGELDEEGPFIDITGTEDIVRRQPVFEVTAITHRRDPIYHALMPAGSEHRALMGLPKEFDIHRAVRAVCDCRDVAMTPGSGCWLHAVVVIAPRDPDDGRRAIQAAFAAHRSLKTCIVVDPDIDPRDPSQVDWALATRFQAHRDLVVLHDQPSSSLDPSAEHPPGRKARGSKMGLDATIKARGAARRAFQRVVP